MDSKKLHSKPFFLCCHLLMVMGIAVAAVPEHHLGLILLVVTISQSVQCLNDSHSYFVGYSPDQKQQELLVLQHLLAAGYTSYTRPLNHDKKALEVRLRLSIIKIQNLWERTDVHTEALETSMRIQLNWCDDMLSWEPESFGDVTSVIIPGDKLWIPDIQIINALDDVYTLTRDRRFDFKLHSDGCVWWYPTGTTLTRCQLNLSYFPFDIQRCLVIFESAMYPKEYLNLTQRYDKKPISLKTFSENGQWDLIVTGAESKLNYVSKSTAFARVEFILGLGRKTRYYQLNVLCPCGMLSALQVLTFLLPIGSEDRITQATTVLLSFVVFQSVIVAELPRTSTSIPLLCLYIDFLTGVSVITVTNAILSVYLLKTVHLSKAFKKNSVLYPWWYKKRAKSLKRRPPERQDSSLTPLTKLSPPVKASVSVGTSVDETDIIDADSLNGLPEEIETSHIHTNSNYINSRRSCLLPVSSSFTESPVRFSPRRQVAVNVHEHKESRMQRVAAHVDNVIFVIVMASSVFVPIIMFGYMPPNRDDTANLFS